MHRIRHKKGVILIFVLLILVALMGVALAFWYAINSEIKSAGAGLANAQAFYIAEAGLARARWAFTVDGQPIKDWSGATGSPFGAGKGTYIVTAAYSDPPTNQYVTITSDGYIPDETNYVAHRQVEESNIPIESGTNLSLASNGTKVSSSPYQDGNGTDNLIDGDEKTKWISTTEGSSWLQLEYKSATTVDRVVVSGSKIDACVVQYSNDGSIWTNVSNPSSWIDASKKYPPGQQTFTAIMARYLKLNITGGNPRVNEFKSYAGTGGAVTLRIGEFSTSTPQES